jgi:geranylgeranyl reductase family protein
MFSPMTPTTLSDIIQAEVAILGAGPAGTAAAIHLGQLGIHNVVLVDRDTFPRDKTCGSGVSPKGLQTLKALGVWDDVSRDAYSIKGVRLVTRYDREVYISGGDSASAVICRRRTLDNLLLKRALSLGVQFIPHFEAQALVYEGNRVAGFTARDKRTVRARYTVVANGAHSGFTVNPQQPKRMLQGIMGWWEQVPFKANHVEMVFDKVVAPHYGWLFPESCSRVNIGICYEDVHHTKNARVLFDQFIQKHYRQRLTGALQVGDWKGHPISYSYRIAQLHSPGRLVIGEAGRMTHPATAEGIYQGMRSGMIAAEALRDVISRSKNEQQAWTAYQSCCRRAFLASFWSARLWRRAVASPLLDVAVRFGQTPMVQTALAKLMAQM